MGTGGWVAVGAVALLFIGGGAYVVMHQAPPADEPHPGLQAAPQNQDSVERTAWAQTASEAFRAIGSVATAYGQSQQSGSGAGQWGGGGGGGGMGGKMANA